MTSTEWIGEVRDHLGEQVLSVEERTPGRLYAELQPEAVVPAADWLFNERGARFVITVGVDRRPLNGHFKALHIFSLDVDQLFLTLCTELNGEAPEIDSITPRVPAANWAERELHDVIGVKLRGHPDPRRLVLADDWPEGVFPLRKDFPYNSRPEPDPAARPALKEPPEGATVLPVGPFYPVLEEPAYFRLFIESETIVGCDYRGFYNHRGIEKLGDSQLTINQVPFLAERICGI
jgi:Ni,Fe-hydrogenase III component G